MTTGMTWAIRAPLVFGVLPLHRSFAASEASDGPGAVATWTTGNKLAVGTAATGASKVWFTVAKGVTTEAFYPRLDIPNLQEMQYLVTDGASFADLERDATVHAISMPDEKALEYTVTNTDKRPKPKYRITSTYLTDPNRNTLLIRTRFQSLDGGRCRLYVLMNPSMAGGGGNDWAWWDGDNAALMSSGTEELFGTTMTIVAALKVESPHGFVAHDNGYVGMASDCGVDLLADFRLDTPFDATAKNGNVIQCGQVGGIGTGTTTFTLALGYGADAASALAAAQGSLAAGFAAVESSYRAGWHATLKTSPLKPVPASVSGDLRRRRAYQVALMTLHAAEDKTFPGASIAAFATPWGDYQNGQALNDGYHRVWGRDLYHQATGLLAAGDFAHALRMARFMWNQQFISQPTPGEGTTYLRGAFPRYSPVSGTAGATPVELGCCEQLDQSGFAILLAWMTGLTDATTYERTKAATQNIQSVGPATIERWEEMLGRSPSSIAAQIAGLIAAADIARQNGDTTSAIAWEATADAWLAYLPAWTLTPSGSGAVIPAKACISSNAGMHLRLPNGDVYFRRYVHDYYGESKLDCSGWPENAPRRYGRPWPLLSGKRGEFELALGRSALVYLQALSDASNDGYFVPEQIWDRADIPCFPIGKPTGSAAPLTWTAGQYLRLAQSLDAGHNLDTPSVVLARYGGARPIVGRGNRCLEASGLTLKLAPCNRTSAQAWTWNSPTGALQVQGKCLDVVDGTATPGRVQLRDCSGSPSQEWRWRLQTRLLHVLSRACLQAAGVNARVHRLAPADMVSALASGRAAQRSHAERCPQPLTRRF